ncbi:MAG: hypothetical protein H6730_25535 [Deltaproteobacteria bacterium]|nr:hypothetical protein [Deltaproteobacteria bacterium]
MELRDTRVVGTRPGVTGASDAGVVCLDCTLTGAGLETAANGGPGLLMVGGSAWATLQYFIHRGGDADRPGPGVLLQDGATVDMDYVYLRGPATFGIRGFEGTNVYMRDIVVVEGIGESAEGFGAMLFEGTGRSTWRACSCSSTGSPPCMSTPRGSASCR